MSKDDLEKLLAAFADAWNRHDVDELMSMMTDDGVFDASGGNQVSGERHEGQPAVRAAYAAVFAQYPDAHWGNARHLVTGDRGVSEWTFTGTQKDGKRVEVNGCDLFTFRNGKIAIKNSFRKNRPLIGHQKASAIGRHIVRPSEVVSPDEVASLEELRWSACRPRCPTLTARS